jgi:phage terminase large subunit
MTTVKVSIPRKLISIFSGQADVRAAYGGRGSAKTRTFAKMTAIRAHMWDVQGREGIILCGRQFMNSLDESSLEEIKTAIRSEDWLTEHFEIGDKYVRTKSGRVAYKFAGLDRHIDSIKSKARILLCWVDEAEPVSEEAWQTLIPTLREEDSELWVTWNPKRKGSATDKRFRTNVSPRMKVAELNWRDNPWFPDILDRVRLADLAERPDQYEYIWEGGYAKVQAGSYFAKQITDMKVGGRLGKVSADPLMTMRAVWDIGGTGAKADACSIWICQFVGREIRVLDYYEAQGQPLASHVQWLREKGYDKARCMLPHDGVKHDAVYNVTYESALIDAGFDVEVIPNQGAGAASMRIEAVRRMFPSIWMNEKTTEAGLFALGAYHAKRDDSRGIDLGPNHDWSSHAADAFGLMCVTYEAPRVPKIGAGRDYKTEHRSKSASWMTA